MTALCPDKCSHPTKFGMFELKSYLEYENEGAPRRAARALGPCPGHP